MPEIGRSPFDEMASAYDDTFTNTAIGRTMRAAVWRRLDALFAPGDRVLELNCGTGADARHLLDRGVEVTATDASSGMVAAARSNGIDARVCRAEEVAASLGHLALFDGAFSDFGGLNCVDDVGDVMRQVGSLVRPGGRALVCVMGPVVPWEIAWFLAHGRPRSAIRRWHRSTTWRGMTIRYPSARSLARTASPWFEVRRTWALGALVPPSYVESLAARHPRALERLDRWERRIERWAPVVALADHYVLEFERRAGIDA